ncbi:hypothetical protein SGRI78S_03037 [Streptomyces griseus subsp. griseus]
MPVPSSACQAVSSSNRCCGSIAVASRGEIPKNSGSNASAS